MYEFGIPLPATTKDPSGPVLTISISIFCLCLFFDETSEDVICFFSIYSSSFILLVSVLLIFLFFSCYLLIVS